MGNKIPLIFPAVMAGGAAVPWYLSGGVAAANCVAAYQPLGAANIAASYVNKVNPGTYNLAPTSGPTTPAWDTLTGWTFDGAATFLQALDLKPAAGAVRTWTMIARFSACPANTGYMMGYVDGAANYWTFTPRRAGGSKFINGGAGGALISTAATSGVIAMAGATCYIDGVSLGTCTLGSSGDGSAHFYMGCLNGPTLYCAAAVQMVAIYNTVLTPTQIGAITNAMGFFSPALDYSVVVIPDEQTLTQSFPDNVVAQTNWIVNNKDTYKTAAVLGLGDYVETAGDATQMARAEAMFDAFDAVNLPYLATQGNHDDMDVLRNGLCPNHNSMFPVARYTGKSWWSGGFYDATKSQNAYLVIGNNLYLILEWGPRQATIDWAKTICAANPSKNVVLISHCIENSDGSFLTAGDDYNPHDYYADDTHDGLEIWDELGKLYSNIILCLSGHIYGAARHTATGDAANPVESLLQNWQGQGEDFAYLRILSFYGKNIFVRTYNAYGAGAWVTDAANQFWITLP